MILQHAFDRATGRRIEFSRNATGLVSQATGVDCVPHRFRHGKRILCAGNSRIHQHRVGTVFHGQGRVLGGPDTGIHDDGHFNGFHDDFQVVRITDSEPGSDGRS